MNKKALINYGFLKNGSAPIEKTILPQLLTSDDFR
jgi:hypothetical protein